MVKNKTFLQRLGVFLKKQWHETKANARCAIKDDCEKY